MDASASKKAQVTRDISLNTFFLHVENRRFRSMSANQNNTVIKFTKLPEYDFDSQVTWPRKNTYVLQPHLRRIVTLNDENFISTTSRSLKSDIQTTRKQMSPVSKRKIVTICEEDFKQNGPIWTPSRKSLSSRSEVKPVTELPQITEKSDEKLSTPKKSSRYINKIITKSNVKPVANSKINNEPKNNKIAKTSPFDRTQAHIPNRDTKVQAQESKSRLTKEKENSQCLKRSYLSKKTTSNVSKTSMNSNLGMQAIKSDFSSNRKSNVSPNKHLMSTRTPSVIKVPIEQKVKQIVETRITHFKIQPITNSCFQVDCNTDIDKEDFFKHVSVGTDQEPQKADVNTETDYNPIDNSVNVSVQTTNYLKSNFDSLDIPNVTLIKDKNNESKEDIVKQCSDLSPEPDVEVAATKDTLPEEKSRVSNRSFIIGHSTVSYSTDKKVDFNVVSDKEEAPSSITSSPLAYPMSVVSVFRKENKNKAVERQPDCTQNKKDRVNPDHLKRNDDSDNNKLVKPSELISTIRLNNGLLQNDYICEQFQRELNFIDSFFESLQYLENCSLSNKSFTDTSVENWVSKSGFDVNMMGPEYSSLFSKFENSTNIDDNETMASKSLCLLNLLIRDEQRRAKNLLFVLKMREDALKDFTKSQILWLENKKKHDNIDIPTLKKKQRGALLKLQHECGEMQRMRKALLALSERRKVALIKTKKNIELKLKNNVTVNQILLGKKKIKRNSISDRPTVPLKCFDLSSSGCDDSTTSRAKSDAALVVLQPETAPVLHADPVPAPNPTPAQLKVTIKSEEKSIQTGESLLSPTQVDESTGTTTELFVTVDGGYLNILFNNFSLPEIFSYGKNYEVNQEALKSIVNSANNKCVPSENTMVEKFIDQIKRDQDRSTTPSTARSLVEELDQYYKGLADEDLLSVESAERLHTEDASIGLVEVGIDPMVKLDDAGSLHTVSTMKIDFKCSQVSFDDNSTIPPDKEISTHSVCTDTENNKKVTTNATQAGPLPVPAGAAVGTDIGSGSDITALIPPKSSTTSIESVSSVPLYMKTSVVSPMVSSLVSLPVQNEAEELRRQQLAIEREIKALEQQQCQLLAVREIPDKPPPPYIPPAEARASKPARMFTADDTLEQKVEKNLSDDKNPTEPTDAFEYFVQDFCQEAVEKHKKDPSDKPWDACNLLPHKPHLSQKGLVQKTTAELEDVLKGVSSCTASNVSTRRSDHIDDILFAEWRRYEADWTALHVDEEVVKGQVFESIFQSILVKSVEEYKKIIQRDLQSTESE